MEHAQEQHLQRILSQTVAQLREKYETGQAEHGGNLWEKPGLLDEAIKEALDQVIYLLTLREQRPMVVKFPPNIPATEFSLEFVQGMADRMAMAFLRYGKVADAYPSRVDALASLKIRLERYERTGNTEFLMDAANFAMIEFMHPRHPDAHFTPTDSQASPGRKWHDEVDPSRRSNRVKEWA